MAHEHMKTLVVGGTGQKIGRSRVVWMTTDWAGAEMSCACGFSFQSFTPLGLSQEWCRQAPGTPADTSLYAGSSGDEILVYTDGCVGLGECGGTILGGQMVAPHTDGRLIAATSFLITDNYWRIGKALEAGTAGDVIRVQVGIFG